MMTDAEVIKLADECGAHKITHPTTSSSNFSYHLRQAELLAFTAAIEKLTEERVRAEHVKQFKTDGSGSIVTKLFISPQSPEVEAKLKIAVDCLKELHKCSWLTGELFTLTKQALEKIGK